MVCFTDAVSYFLEYYAWRGNETADNVVVGISYVPGASARFFPNSQGRLTSKPANVAKARECCYPYHLKYNRSSLSSLSTAHD